MTIHDDARELDRTLRELCRKVILDVDETEHLPIYNVLGGNNDIGDYTIIIRRDFKD